MTAEIVAHGETPAEALEAAAAVTGGPTLTQNMLDLRDQVEQLAGDDDVVTIEIQDEPNEADVQVVLLQVLRLPTDPSRAAQAVVPMTRELVDNADVAEFAGVAWTAVQAGFAAYEEKRAAAALEVVPS